MTGYAKGIAMDVHGADHGSTVDIEAWLGDVIHGVAATEPVEESGKHALLHGFTELRCAAQKAEALACFCCCSFFWFSEARRS